MPELHTNNDVNNTLDAKLLTAIKLLDSILSDSSNERKEIFTNIQQRLEDHTREIDEFDVALVELPPKYDEFIRLRKEKRKRKSDNVVDDNELEDVNRALNFHLNKQLDIIDDDIFLAPDELIFDDSLENSTYADDFDNSDTENVNTETITSHSEDNNVETWNEFKKLSMREKLFSEAKELQEKETEIEKELNAIQQREHKDEKECALLTRKLERHQLMRAKTLKCMLYEYKPRLNHHHMQKDRSSTDSLKHVIRDIELQVRAS